MGFDEMDEMDEMALSAIGELANMITGNATTALAETNYVCDISPPVLLPKGASVTVTNPQIRAHFDSPLGSMSIRVGLSEVAD
jgi:chemotaxis protein CheX